MLFFFNFSIVLLYCIAFINISIIFFSQIFYCNYLLKLVLTAKQYNKSLVNLLVGFVLLFAKFFVYFLMCLEGFAHSLKINKVMQTF